MFAFPHRVGKRAEFRQRQRAIQSQRVFGRDAFTPGHLLQNRINRRIVDHVPVGSVPNLSSTAEIARALSFRPRSDRNRRAA